MAMLIDGGWSEASDGAVDPVLNPATGEEIATVPRASAADVARAVAAAQAGAARMAAMPAHARFAVLEAVARRIEANQPALGVLLCRENGKRIGETTSEVGVAARIFRGYAEEAKRVFGRAFPLDTIPGRERSIAITRREPLGVVAAIVPFNYPVELWSHKVAGGLAAGNAVITKTPEDCPLAVIEISRYLEEAGLPRGAHQVVTGGREAGEALVAADGRADGRHDRLDRRRTAHPRGGGADLEEGPPRARRQRRHHRLRGRRRRRHRRGAGAGALHLRQRADLLRGQAGAGAPLGLCPAPRGGGGADPRPPARRPDGPGDRRRPAHQPPRRRAGGGAGAGRPRRRGDARRRRPAHGQLLRADDPDRGRAGDARLRRGDLRAGAAAHPLRRLRDRARSSPTTAPSGCRRRSSPTTSAG